MFSTYRLCRKGTINRSRGPRCTRPASAKMNWRRCASISRCEPEEFLVILIGKDGGEKLHSPGPVGVDQLKQLIDSMPMRKRETKQ